VRRGEVWRVQTVGRDRVVLVVGNDAVTELYNIVQCVPIEDSLTAQDTLVTVPLVEPVKGVAVVVDAGAFRKPRFAELLGDLDNETMERVDVALRAVFDL
jgi:mRNA interferase MazF